MALITCPSCGKPVSSQAATCPSCAHPIAAPGVRGVTWMKVLGTLLMTLSILPCTAAPHIQNAGTAYGVVGGLLFFAGMGLFIVARLRQ